MPYFLLFKLFRAIWPLIKEGLFGKENVADVARKNKVATSWIIAALVCFVSSILLAMNLFRVNSLYLTLNTKYQVEHERLVEFGEAFGGDPLTIDIPETLVDKMELEKANNLLAAYKAAHPSVTCNFTTKPNKPSTTTNTAIVNLKEYWP